MRWSQLRLHCRRMMLTMRIYTPTAIIVIRVREEHAEMVFVVTEAVYARTNDRKTNM